MCFLVHYISVKMFIYFFPRCRKSNQILFKHFLLSLRLLHIYIYRHSFAVCRRRSATSFVVGLLVRGIMSHIPTKERVFCSLNHLSARLWSPPSPLFNIYLLSITRIKLAGAWYWMSGDVPLFPIYNKYIISEPQIMQLSENR